tara:strand:- start:13236 stop:14279 length:1044 start_codon:yes stop_codon:yes gene_type:complete
MPETIETQFRYAEMVEAFEWLCRQRKHFPSSSDIWSFRASWERLRESLLDQVNTGRYCFSPLAAITKSDGKTIHLWCAQDALVMKLLVSRLTTNLDLSRTCTHIKGNGGLKASINRTQKALPHYQFVCKTDVKAFYESIDQHILMAQIDQHIKCKVMRRYLWQVVTRVIDKGGNILSCKQGISRGSALSPILGALYLRVLDTAFENIDLFYLRYMHGILILSKTRWQNRRAVKCLNRIFDELKMIKHPDKTFIGKIVTGFDFLGYQFDGKVLSVVGKTIKKHQESMRRLYEQQAKKKANPDELALRLNAYLQRWTRWCKAGLNKTTLETFCEPIPAHTNLGLKARMC